MCNHKLFLDLPIVLLMLAPVRLDNAGKWTPTFESHKEYNMIHSSSVIKLPTETVRWLSFYWQYLIPSLTQSVKKKTIADGFTGGNCEQKKINFRLKYTDGFSQSVIV